MIKSQSNLLYGPCLESVENFCINQIVEMISADLPRIPKETILRQMTSGSFANTLLVKGEDGKAISIESVRKAIIFAKSTPTLNAHKALVFYSADTMTRQASNALLKLLEEPNKGVLLFLLAKSATAILPTIKSRCHIMRIKPEVEWNTSRGDAIVEKMKAIYSDFSKDPTLTNSRKFFQIHQFFSRTKNGHLNIDNVDQAVKFLSGRR